VEGSEIFTTNHYITLLATTIYTKQTMAKAKRSVDANDRVAGAGMILDPLEVMKAMLAQKGKGKELESGSDEEEDTEDGSDSGEDEDERDGQEEEEEEEEDSGSEAESSRSAEIRQSQSQSQAQSQTSTQNRSSTSRTPNPTSRVTTIPKTNSSPFSNLPKPTASTFESLGMSKPLISALAGINIKKPTEIQSACVGPIMAGRDCIGGAKTGSGKTLAFALPIVERIARDPFGVWCVVLTPTR
jgi:ATP-dependent RNA helicase DDX49/DBP8